VKPLKRRPLKPIKVDKDDANAPAGSPSYLNPVINSGGTMRGVPSLGPSMHLSGRLGGM